MPNVELIVSSLSISADECYKKIIELCQIMRSILILRKAQVLLGFKVPSYEDYRMKYYVGLYELMQKASFVSKNEKQKLYILLRLRGPIDLD